ncbi:hypothetical protein QQ045_002040 [Rhodiola kirilowii]
MRVVTSLLLLLVLGVKLVSADAGEEDVNRGELSQCIDYLVYGHQGPPEVLKASCNSEILEQCCAQLEQFKQEWRCDAINQMLQQEEKHIQSHKLEGVVRRARNLPAMCNMEPHRCDFQPYYLL